MRLGPMKRKAIRQLVILDYLSAALAWFCFWMYRQHLLTGAPLLDTVQKFHLRDTINTVSYTHLTLPTIHSYPAW